MEVELENFDSSNWPAPWNEVLLVDRGTGLKIGLMEHPGVRVQHGPSARHRRHFDTGAKAWVEPNDDTLSRRRR